MLNLNCKIVVGNLQFRYVQELEISSSWENLTDTATIRLPRNLKLRESSLKDLIKVGDQVEVWLGYQPELLLEFKGFIRKVNPETPIVLECEDQMYALKKGSISKQYGNVMLAQLCKEIIPASIPFIAADMQLGELRIENSTPARVLAKLSEIFGLRAFFRDGTLIVGFPYSMPPGNRHTAHFQRNVAESSLKFRDSEDTKIKVKAVSIMPDNSRREIVIGDPEGEERSLHFYNLGQEALKIRAQEEMARLNYTGYEGSVTLFGLPRVKHGDSLELRDAIYPERSGTYLVNKVDISFGDGGYRRSLELGPKVEVAA